MYRLTNKVIEQSIEKLLKDKPELLGVCLDAIYQDLEGSKAAEEFHKNHMTPSCGTITVHDTKKVVEIITPFITRIHNKVVVEIGAGVGLLACGMAKIAKQVYAIESDPAWSWAFTKILYEIKPPNLTFIFGKAESMIGILKADVAVIVTHSGHKEMQAIGKQLAFEVIDVYEQAGVEKG
jgi:protein-L-isoaspartate O-methyltransferase